MSKEKDLNVSERPFPGVNNTKWRRTLTLSLLWVMGGLKRDRSGVWVKKHFVIKHSFVTSRAEVEAMQFVSQHTKIPIPKIYSAFERLQKTSRGERERCVYIMMERMPGEILLKAWPKMNDAEKASVITQLRRFFDELRSLAPPRPGAVGSALTYGPITDVRWLNYKYGPCDTLDEFHEISGTAYTLQIDNEAIYTRDPQVVEQEERRKVGRTTRFTHGDLNTTNILYKDGKITAILDWGCSGWLPEYWEYTQSWHTIIWDEHWWKEQLAQFLDHYPHELEMDKNRHLFMDQ